MGAVKLNLISVSNPRSRTETAVQSLYDSSKILTKSYTTPEEPVRPAMLQDKRKTFEVVCKESRFDKQKKFIGELKHSAVLGCIKIVARMRARCELQKIFPSPFQL